jgi:hypothetical protein
MVCRRLRSKNSQTNGAWGQTVTGKVVTVTVTVTVYAFYAWWIHFPQSGALADLVTDCVACAPILVSMIPLLCLHW